MELNSKIFMRIKKHSLENFMEIFRQICGIFQHFGKDRQMIQNIYGIINKKEFFFENFQNNYLYIWGTSCEVSFNFSITFIKILNFWQLRFATFCLSVIINLDVYQELNYLSARFWDDFTLSIPREMWHTRSGEN